MYCIGCGSALPNGAQFCQGCGKRSVLDGNTFASDSSKLPQQTGTGVVGWLQSLTAIPTNETDEIPESEHSEQSGADPVMHSTETCTQADSAPEGTSAEPAIRNSKAAPRSVNAGSITLAVVALICVVIGVIQGFIPIFLIEGVAFGGLAWLCAARWPLSPLLHSIVLVSSLLLAGLVGVTLDQDTFGPRYRYLSQGSVQYRIDEKAGRTDRLTNGGWYPVAYDKEAQEMNPIDAVFKMNMTKGQWTSTLGGQICFSVTNSSDYIVDRITIKVKTQKQSDSATRKDGAANSVSSDAAALDQEVILKSYGGGFISPGSNPLVCASSPRDLSADETWTYTDMHAYGWKR